MFNANICIYNIKYDQSFIKSSKISFHGTIINECFCFARLESSYRWY